MNKKEILNKVEIAHNYIRSIGYNPVISLLYGSQNYGLDTDKSDIDVHSYYIPSLDDLINNRSLGNKVYKHENGEVVCRDIRLLPELLKKTNPVELETLFTEFAVSELQTILLDELFSEREKIASHNLIRFFKSIGGYLNNLYETTIKNTEGDKLGYSAKEYQKFLRLFHIGKSIHNEEPFANVWHVSAVEGVDMKQIRDEEIRNQLIKSKTKVDRVKIVSDKMSELLKEYSEIYKSSIEAEYLVDLKPIEVLSKYINDEIKHHIIRELS